MASSVPHFRDLRPSVSSAPVQSLVAVQPIRRKGKGALGARCDFVGFPTNLIIVTSTTLILVAGRFGMASSANRKATSGLKGEVVRALDWIPSRVHALGHIISVRVVLGLKNIGAL